MNRYVRRRQLAILAEPADVAGMDHCCNTKSRFLGLGQGLADLELENAQLDRDQAAILACSLSLDPLADDLRRTAGQIGLEAAGMRFAQMGRNDQVRDRPTDCFIAREAEKRFQAKAQTAQNKLKQEIAKREKLAKNLNQDLENHGDAEQWKRFGDLLLANLANAERKNGKVSVTDFYDENLRQIEIEIENFF